MQFYLATCFFNLHTMSLSCLIFDDDAAAIAEVSFLIGKYASNWSIVGIASTTEECRNLLKTNIADIIFTDIHFGDEIIFDALPELKSVKGDLVFITADNGFATQAFQLSATSYILKPINEHHFIQALQKYQTTNLGNTITQTNEVLFHNLNESHSSFKKIAFNTNTGYVIKEVNDIIYAKANSNYTEFYFTDIEKILVSKTLLEYEKMLENYGFFRIHQSYLVNLKYMSKFDNDSLQMVLENGEVLPVSNRRKSNLLDILRGVF
jgi:two-component system LytT family response regulator